VQNLNWKIAQVPTENDRVQTCQELEFLTSFHIRKAMGCAKPKIEENNYLDMICHLWGNKIGRKTPMYAYAETLIETLIDRI
jgi:hypothetical protein